MANLIVEIKDKIVTTTLQSTKMKSSSTARCCGVFIAFIILFVIGESESFIDTNHPVAFRRTTSSLSLNKRCEINSIFDACNSKNKGSLEDLLVDDFTRRRSGQILFQTILAGAISWQSGRQIVNADDGSAVFSPKKENIILSGRVNLPSGMTDSTRLGDTTSNAADSISKPALYVTARPDRPDNVPKAILDGSRGKSPPILAARFESPEFPFDFKLSEMDLTPEGIASNNGTTNSGAFWWAADDLIVSARWDSDGVAATRSPDDLVGRSQWKRNAANEGFVLELQGRGTFGKFATKKN